MWNKTAFTERLGIEYPIVQGPFGGGLSSTRLASIVSNAGGMGSYGADSLTPRQITDLVLEMRSLTANPFAVNLWIPKGPVATPTPSQFEQGISLLAGYYKELGIERPDPPERYGQDFDSQVQALLDARPPVFSFVYGIPDASILHACRERRILTAGTATTPGEAVALDRAGVDCIIASGHEAGGHKGAFLMPVENSLYGTFALVPQVVDRVTAPVIAAGGVADGRGIKAALALGASGVQIGTAFLATKESGASKGHRDLLFGPEGEDTILTNAFTGRVARSIGNRLATEMRPLAGKLPDYPLQSWYIGTLKQAAIAQDRPDLTSLWCGQAAPLLRFNNARALFTALVRGASE